MAMPKCIIDMMENKNSLRTIEVQTVQKRKNEPRQKFTGSYKINV